MRASHRRHLSYASFLVLLAIDTVAGIAFLLNQLLDMPWPWLWMTAVVLAVLALPGLLRLADRVFALARAARNIPLAGESFP